MPFSVWKNHQPPPQWNPRLLTCVIDNTDGFNGLRLYLGSAFNCEIDRPIEMIAVFTQSNPLHTFKTKFDN